MSTQRIPRPAKRFLYLVFTAVFACPAGAGETYWQHDPNVPGDWFDANNWTAGLPTSHWTSSAYVDNGGTALISSGDAVAGTEYVGYSFVGAVNQTGGTHTVDDLTLGLNADANGTYELSGGHLYAGGGSIGFYGTGRFIQSAGTSRFWPALYLGFVAGSYGIYELSGSGHVSGDRAFVGSGRFIQTGGTNAISNRLTLECSSDINGRYELSGAGELSAVREFIGDRHTGRFVQTGGTNTVTEDLRIGSGVDGNGTYELGGDGHLSADWEVVGGAGRGRFVQTGGTNTVSGELRSRLQVGAGSDSDGTYELTGGRLSAGDESVGEYGTGRFVQAGGTNTVTGGLHLGLYEDGDGTYELSDTGALSAAIECIGWEGSGEFLQTGGTNTVGYLWIGENGRYEMTGGSLLPSEGLRLSGELDFAGSGVALVWDNVVVDISAGGTVLNDTHASLTLGLNTLTIVPTGSGPGDFFENYSTAGLVHTAGTTLLIPAGNAFVWRGPIDDHVHCEGSLLGPPVPTWWFSPRLELTNGVRVSGSGVVDFGPLGGLVTVDDEVSGISGGQLSAGLVLVGRRGTGRFVQTGGTVTLGGLALGLGFGSSGTYELSGTGQLRAGEESVGDYSTGRFVQTGGTNTVSGELYVGGGLYSMQNGDGTYELSGGEASAGELHVGPTGRFSQSGGVMNVGRAVLDGDFSLTGGTFSAGHVDGDLVNDGGTFSPGGSAGLTEMLGDYTQNAGTLEIEIGGAEAGSEYDVLSVSGDVTLGGGLHLELIDSFRPEYGDEFEFLVGGSIAGTFESIEGVELAPNMSLAVVYEAGRVLAVAALPGDADLDGNVDRVDFLALRGNYGRADACWSEGDLNGDSGVDFRDYLVWKANAGCSVPGAEKIPEPSTLTLVGLGAMVVGWRRRRRQAGEV